MPKYVRFEEDKDVQWLIRLMEKAVQKIKNETHLLTDENVEVIPRIYDALLQAGDIEIAEHIGVPKKIVEEDKKAKEEKKKSRKKAKASKSKTVKHDYCKDHPTYGAIQRPSRDCKTCWAAYKKLHPMEYDVKRRDFLRKQKEKEQEAS